MRLGFGLGLQYSKLSGGGSSFEGILNQFPGASLGLSLDKLDKNYTGSAIKVRRSSGNDELDIGFVNNELDTASLLDFVGSGNGFVSIWYDQSGEGNNATQTSAISQPKIINNGTLILENGKPAINFDGVNHHFIVWNNTTAPTIFQDMSDAITILIIERARVISGTANFWRNSNAIVEIRQNSDSEGTSVTFNIGYSQNKFGFGVTDNYVTGANLKFSTELSIAQRISMSIFNGNNLNVNLNSESKINSTFTVATGDRSIGSGNSSMTIGVRSKDEGQSDDKFYTGNIQEIILYKEIKTSDRSAMENNRNAIYNIY